MQLKRLLAAAPLASLLLITGCSKTEDVAPERKIFGDPPTILNFRILNPDGSEATLEQLPPVTVECDFTKIMEDRFCTFGAPGSQADPPITVGGTYTQVIFEAVVDDPNHVRDSAGRITQSNLLLVSSSFVLPGSTVETTLVLFNDGGANKFPQAQKVSGIGEDCTVDDFGNCFCQGATYLVDSNDPVKEDGTPAMPNEIFTRAFAFVNQTTSPYLQDCIMRDKRQVPFPSAPGARFTFRIDAVDRQGNLHTWPKEPEVVSGQDTFVCNGDACGCCFINSNDPFSDCPDKPGMRSPSAPNGFCVDFL